MGKAFRRLLLRWPARPSHDDSDLGPGSVLGARHDEGLAIWSHIVPGNSNAAVKFPVEELHRLSHQERRLHFYRNTHHLGSASVGDLASVPHPSRLFTTVG